MTSDFPAGNYRFIPAVFQYSGGVAANPGFEVERVRFDKLVPAWMYSAICAKPSASAGRPLTAFCACELRSPAAFTDDGFEWGLYDGKTNPVARSNVCPEIDPPAEPSFHAFSFTRPRSTPMPSFVIAGSGESIEGGATYAERTVRYRDLSPDGLKDKIRHVVGAMERRMGEFGFGWKDATAAQTYTVHDFHPVFAEELVRRGAARSGLTWHFARPPVIDLEYEMDCRRVMREIVI
jgi:hypothetical protein